MTDTTLVAAIQALTAEMALLRQAVEAIRDQPRAAAPAVASAPAPAAPKVTAAAVRAAAGVAVVAPRVTNPVTAVPPVKERSLAEIESERVRSEVEALLVGAFMATSVEDYDAGFESFLELMHSGRTDAPRSIPSLKEFTWKSLHRKRDMYLEDPLDPTSYTVERWHPSEPRVKDDIVKLFLKVTGRSPVPINFRRDPEQDGAFRITDSSL